MRKGVLQPHRNYDMDVKQRVKMYRLLLYSQIVATVLVTVGFIIFLLIVARIIQF